MDHQQNREDATSEKGDATAKGEQNLTRATNPEPRANENLEGDNLPEGAAEGVGSEITDGEAS